MKIELYIVNIVKARIFALITKLAAFATLYGKSEFNDKFEVFVFYENIFQV